MLIYTEINKIVLQKLKIVIDKKRRIINIGDCISDIFQCRCLERSLICKFIKVHNIEEISTYGNWKDFRFTPFDCHLPCEIRTDEI